MVLDVDEEDDPVHANDVYWDVDEVVPILLGSCVPVTKNAVVPYLLRSPVTNPLKLGTEVDWSHVADCITTIGTCSGIAADAHDVDTPLRKP